MRERAGLPRRWLGARFDSGRRRRRRRAPAPSSPSSAERRPPDRPPARLRECALDRGEGERRRSVRSRSPLPVDAMDASRRINECCGLISRMRGIVPPGSICRWLFRRALQVHVHIAFGGHEADGAALRRCDTRTSLTRRRGILQRCDQAANLPVGPVPPPPGPRRFDSPRSSRRRRVAADGTACPGNGHGLDPEIVDRVGQQQNLDALRLSPPAAGVRCSASASLAGDVVDRLLAFLHPPDVLIERHQLVARGGCGSGPAAAAGRGVRDPRRCPSLSTGPNASRRSRNSRSPRLPSCQRSSTPLTTP